MGKNFSLVYGDEKRIPGALGDAFIAGPKLT
jgi:hypothetical protein